MARERLFRLQRHILAWLVAEDQRLRGTMAASHEGLVRALAALIGFLGMWRLDRLRNGVDQLDLMVRDLIGYTPIRSGTTCLHPPWPTRL